MCQGRPWSGWTARPGGRRAELLPEKTTDTQAQLNLRYRLSALVADEYAHHGWTAVVQDIILGDDLTRYVARVHIRPLYVVVLAPLSRSCGPERPRARRSGTTSGRSRHSTTPWAETPPIRLWLDTSEHTPAQTVSAILDNLPAARLESG